MPITGGAWTQITSAPDYVTFPAWSPDGSHLAYAQRMNDFSFDIFSLVFANSSTINLTNTPGVEDIAPDWSPDGTRIAYRSDDGFHTMSPITAATT